MCEAVDSIASVSAHLCHLLGLPTRECAPVSRQPVSEEDQLPSDSSSPGEGTVWQLCGRQLSQ